MSFFNFLSGGSSSSEKDSFPWKPLEQPTQLDKIIEQSFEKTVVIFKHSTRCSISRFALKQWESDCQPQSLTVDFFLIDLLNFREVSQQVSERFQITHESPQIIVLKEGKAISHASHQDIQWDEVKFVL